MTVKSCCEGGKMSAGCYHDNCAGPKEQLAQDEEVITEYKITNVDFWEKDAILEIAGKNVYFQFDGEETPTLVDVIKYLVKEADAHYD